MTVLEEYKLLQTQRFGASEEERVSIDEQLDELWIRLTDEDVEETRQYGIQLWINYLGG